MKMVCITKGPWVNSRSRKPAEPGPNYLEIVEVIDRRTDSDGDVSLRLLNYEWRKDGKTERWFKSRRFRPINDDKQYEGEEAFDFRKLVKIKEDA